MGVNGRNPDIAVTATRDGPHSRIVGVGRTGPPRQRITTAPRDVLLERLERSRGAALTVIQSPAGFGKTVLLTQWFERLRLETTMCVAWLSLDENDREVMRFVGDVGSTLATAGVELPPDCLLHARSSADVAYQLEAIGDAINARNGAVLLFLDDYHRATAVEVDALVEQLIRGNVGNLQVVLASRDRLPLRIADLEAQGLVHRIGSTDLLLNIHETQTLFGPTYPEDVVRALHGRTEGWAVALQIAKLWLEGDLSRQRQLVAFTGRTDALARYLVERVLADADEDVRSFLMETALLGTFDAASADAIRGTGSARMLLGRLAQFDALLVPLDSERRWYRYHQLFAEFLGDRLDEEAPGRSVQIHAAAADHYLRIGDIGRSVAHACEAGDTARALSGINRAGGWEIVLQQGIGVARGLLAHFPALELEREPVLLRMRGYLEMKEGSLTEARRLVDTAAQADASAIGRRDRVIIDALLRTYADDLLDAEWGPRVAADLEALDPADAIGRGTLRAALAVYAIGLGDFTGAERESAAGEQAMTAAASVLGQAYCSCHRSRAFSLAGRYIRAETVLRGVLADVEQRHGGDRALTTIVSGLLGAVLFARGSTDSEARALLAVALTGISTHDSWLDVLAAAYEAGTRQAIMDGDYEAAHTLLDQGERIAAQRSLHQLQALVHAWRIEILLAAGQVDDAAAAAAASVPYPSWRIRLATSLAVAQTALRTGRSAEALRALHVARAEADGQGRAPDLLRIDLLLATAYRARGETERMLFHARVGLANPCAQEAPGLLRGLAIRLAPLLASLSKADAGLEPDQREQARLLRAAVEPAAAGGDRLSGRERAVLAALCAGCSNKEIGRQLDLTENTVKFHLKNIFGKLGTKSRAATVGAALGRGLVEG